MADDSKLELRDLREQDEGPYLTKSNAELDLEARTTDGRPNEAVGSATLTLNPNPLGADEYVGVDPIYQNYANETEKPLASQDGVEKEVEQAHRKAYDLSDVDDSQKVVDPGLGGETTKVGAPGGQTFRTVLPGQEGYDLKKAEEQNGPPLRVYLDDDSSGGDGEVEQVDQSGTNRGGTTEPPAPPSSPEDTTDASGTKTDKKAAVKPPSDS